MSDAEILIQFAPKGDAEVLDAIKKVSRHVGDLKKIASAPIDLQVVKNSMSPEDFNRLKSTIDRAKEATKDYGKEAAIAAREQARLAAAAEKAAARAQVAAEKAAIRESALSERMALKAERDASRKAAAAEKAAARAAAAFERAAAREARANPMMGGITGSMMGGGRMGVLPLGGASSMGPDPRAFSTKAINELNKSLGNTATAAKNAGFHLGFVARIIAAMGVRALVREVFQLADAYTTLQNKLKVTVGEDSLGFVSKEIFKIAQDSRTSLESVTTAFSRTTRSVKALGKSQHEVLVFTDALSKAIAVGGSTSVEASNAMIQLSQGMGSGALRGDELRSVLEQLPIVAELIADKMGVPISALRKLGSEGKITTEVIFDAISGKSEELTEKMKTMQLTVGQAWTMLKNQATMSSSAMQGVMNALANTLQLITNHFEGFITVVLMLASGSVMGMLIKGIMAAKDAFIALRVVMLAHPLLAAAAVVATLAAAFIPLITNLRIAEGSTLTFGDVWSSTWDEIKSTFFDDDVNDGIKTVDASINGLTESTRSWIVELANAADWIVKLTPFGSGNLFNNEHGFKNFAEKLVKRIDQDADFRETERMLKEAKELMAEDMSFDKGLNTQGPPTPTKTKNPKGQTFEELMEDLNRNREKAAITSDLNQDTIESRVAKEWLDAVDKLEDKIANGLTPAQSSLIEKTIEEKIILEDMLKLREHIQQSIKDEEKAQVEAFVKYYDEWFKFQEAQKKAVLEFQEARADRETNKFEKFQTIGDTLDPNQEVKRQIRELEEFNKFARDNKLADWAKLSKDRIEELKASMRWENTHFETFADQMNSIFGPGGTLVKGFADAAANAIVMSESLSDLRRALVDVLNSVQKQALSALIQLPMNLAIGALTNSITGGGATSSLAGGTGGSGAKMNNDLWNSLGPKKFSSGGYTGNVGTGDIAGIVHGQEYVLNADATRRMGKQNLDLINKGATPSASSAPTNITINNNAGVHVEARELSPGEVEVMITKAIRDQTGRVVAGMINDPNSPVSRSMQKNLDTGRRRV